MDLIVPLLLFGLWIWGAYAVSRMADRLGRSAAAFGVLAVLTSPVVGWIVVSAVSPLHPRPGDAAKVIQRIELADGTELRPGYVAKVVDTDVKEQTPVVQIEVDGRLAWVARSAMRRA